METTKESSYEWEHKTMFTPAEEELIIEVETENLPVRITGEEERVQIEVMVYAKEKIDEEDLEEFINIEFDEATNTLFVKSYSIAQRLAFAEIKAPKKARIDAKSEMTKISINGIEGDVKVQNENGPVSVYEIKGNLILENENGPLKAINILGNINTNCENGGVKFEGCEGDIYIETENGGTKIIDCKGENLKLMSENGAIRIMKTSFVKNKIESENGSIYHEVNPGSLKNSIQNENGKITVIVPNEVECDLIAGNELGAIKVGIEGDYDIDKSEDRKVIKLKRASGRTKITLENDTGSIAILDSPKQTKHKEFKFDFDFDSIGETFDKFGEQFEKFGENFEKNFKFDMPNIDIEGIKDTVKTALKNIPKDEIKSALKDVKFKIKEEMKSAMKDMKRAKEDLKRAKDDIKADFEHSSNFHSDAEDADFEVPETPEAPKPPKPPKSEKIKIITKKVNEGLEKAFDKINEAVSSNIDPEETKKEVNSQSKIKILEMLQNGKISVDEAEKLLKAIGE